MKPSDLSEFFNLLGKAKKEKEEEFDNLLKEADINLDDLTSSLVSGIKEAKEDQKKQKKNEEKLIEQLDSIIDVIENPKEVKDITEPAVTVGVPEDFDVTTLEDADDNETVEIIDIIKPEPIKTPEISDTVAQAIKFIEETNIKEEIENSDDTNLDKLKTEIKQVRDILYKVLAHGPGSGEVNLLKLDDVDEDTAKVDGRFLKYDASSGKFVGGSGGAGSQNLDDTLGLGNTSVLGMSIGVITATSFVGDGSQLTNIGSASTANVRTGILDVTGIATFRSDTLIGSGVTLSPDGDVFATGVTTSSSFVGDLTGDVTGTASNATQLNSQAASYYLDYDNFSNTPTIPSNNNQLTNGAGYITGSALNASNLSSGTIPDARFPSTLPAIDGSALTGIANTSVIFTDKISLGDNERISVGLSSDLSIYHDSTQSIIADTGTGQLAIRGGVTVSISNPAGTQVMANFINGGAVNLFHAGVNRFKTTSTGAVVTGILTATSNVNVGSGITLSPDGDIFAVGVSTFTDEIHLTTTGNTLRFKDDSGNQLGAIAGNSSNLGFFGNANNNGRFDFYTGGAYRFRIQPGGDINVGTAVTIGGVTGHARYTGIVTAHGGVNVGSGVTLSPDGDVFATGVTTSTTFVGALTGNVTGNASGSSGSCTGNAATATKLAATKTIAGVAFDGSANISLNNNAITNGAGYITATLTNEQVQDIVGGMVSSNTETGITVTYQDDDGTIDLIKKKRYGRSTCRFITRSETTIK